MRKWKHKDRDRLVGTEVEVGGTNYFICDVAMDGTLILETPDVYFSTRSMSWKERHAESEAGE